MPCPFSRSSAISMVYRLAWRYSCQVTFEQLGDVLRVQAERAAIGAGDGLPR
jgi:hypothetical protein